MRKLLTLPALAIACGLLLSSCATIPPGGGTAIITDPITGGLVSTEVAGIQAAVAQGCSFEPAYATVANILSTFIPGAAPIATIIDQAARGICSAITAKSFRRGGAPPRYRGIAIKGRFVAP
jgi:hypothetical protein